MVTSIPVHSLYFAHSGNSRGFKSERHAKEALKKLKLSGQIADWEEAPPSNYAYDFTVTLNNGSKVKFDAKSSQAGVDKYKEEGKPFIAIDCSQRWKLEERLLLSFQAEE